MGKRKNRAAPAAPVAPVAPVVAEPVVAEPVAAEVVAAEVVVAPVAPVAAEVVVAPVAPPVAQVTLATPLVATRGYRGPNSLRTALMGALHAASTSGTLTGASLLSMPEAKAVLADRATRYPAHKGQAAALGFFVSKGWVQPKPAGQQ